MAQVRPENKIFLQNLSVYIEAGLENADPLQSQGSPLG